MIEEVVYPVGIKMDKSKIKLIAMDLDGTLSQHKEQLDEEHHAAGEEEGNFLSPSLCK